MEIDFKSKYATDPHADVVFARYPNGNIAIQLYSSLGEPLTRATVNIGEVLEEGNVLIYGDYSEHEGVHQGLVDAGLVGPELRQVPLGGFDAYGIECKLLVTPEFGD